VKATLYTDGASSGNPGPAGIGAFICVDGREVDLAEHIGTASNNVAEYMALIRGLEEALALGATDVEAFLDSELVVKQIRGVYRVKHPDLIPLHERALKLKARLKRFTIAHVRRELNTRADKLSKIGAEGKCTPKSARPDPRMPEPPVAEHAESVKPPGRAQAAPPPSPPPTKPASVAPKSDRGAKGASAKAAPDRGAKGQGSLF
jgi:ribonuclease HI